MTLRKLLRNLTEVENLQDCSQEELGELFRDCVQYLSEGKEPELLRVEDEKRLFALWSMLREWMDKTQLDEQHRREASRRYHQKRMLQGWRPVNPEKDDGTLQGWRPVNPEKDNGTLQGWRPVNPEKDDGNLPEQQKKGPILM